MMQAHLWQGLKSPSWTDSLLTLSLCRQLFAEGKPISADLLDPKVVEYIHANELFVASPPPLPLAKL
jgi:hypothetical protein